MVLTESDASLLDRCLKHEPGSWNEFVDRYLGLIYHVVTYTSHYRSVPLTAEDVEDVAADVLMRFVDDDYAILRRFQKKSSLAGYLTVVARRACVQELNKRITVRERPSSDPLGVAARPGGMDLEGLEEVQKILRKLPAREREVVRMFYIEGRAYEEIAKKLNVRVNSIGPILSRARKRLSQQKGKPKPGENGPAPKE